MSSESALPLPYRASEHDRLHPLAKALGIFALMVAACRIAYAIYLLHSFGVFAGIGVPRSTLTKISTGHILTSIAGCTGLGISLLIAAVWILKQKRGGLRLMEVTEQAACVFYLVLFVFRVIELLSYDLIRYSIGYFLYRMILPIVDTVTNLGFPVLAIVILNYVIRSRRLKITRD